jgi:mercuric ion transport protein
MRASPILAGVGGIAAGFLGALCCVGPLIVLTFGVGAGLASFFEPLRPFFGLVMVGAFGVGFYGAYRADPECASDDCARPKRRTDRLVLWLALLVALVLWTFPAWSVWLL